MSNEIMTVKQLTCTEKKLKFNGKNVRCLNFVIITKKKIKKQTDFQKITFFSIFQNVSFLLQSKLSS